MKKPEAQFWELLKEHKAEALPGDVSRVENYADTGTPDLSCARGQDYWVELKAVTRPVELKDESVGKGVIPLLEPTQGVWHARRVSQGTHIFMLIKYDNAILLWKCYAPERYDLLLTVPKVKNTFAYSQIGEAILKTL